MNVMVLPLKKYALLLNSPACNIGLLSLLRKHQKTFQNFSRMQGIEDIAHMFHS